LRGGFFFDDGPSILLAQGVRLENLSLESVRQALVSGGAGPSGRPVAQLSFALNYYFSGFDPFVFKASNLAIHIACGFIVFALALSSDPCSCACRESSRCINRIRCGDCLVAAATYPATAGFACRSNA
jgi:hypothetical protein